MKSLIFTIVLAFFISAASAQNFNDLKKKAEKKITLPTTAPKGFSEEEAGKALKEALNKGALKGSLDVSKLDGYFGNPKIKIPFPPDAQKIEEKLRSIGLNKECDDVILSVNRAAEDAGSSAKDIFSKVISEMTITDAINIVKGADNAGTECLKSKSRAMLVEAFKPIIKTSLDKVGATKNWELVITKYNKIPFVEKVNPDLVQYATEKAIDGLFVKVAEEELQIRKDPIARTTDLLKKVFGNK
ncbi:MAG: DUF4197 domain-containing protein [Bacteroidota bacterium]